jgi:O-acetyl-ADP-ribose deacetylase (regulator of RNase III)
MRRARCAEVWVNSENTDMQMARCNEFSVSSIIRYEGSIRNAAGKVVDDCIAAELAARLDSGSAPVPPGTAILTGPGELRRHGVRRIVHVASVHGEPGAGFRQVRDVGRCVTSALAAVDDSTDRPPLTTVLFPLLGAGHGGGEVRHTVVAMAGAVVDYFAATPNSHVTSVYFLAYTDAELTTCLREFNTHRRLQAVNASAEADIIGIGRGHSTVEPLERIEPPAGETIEPVPTAADASCFPTRKTLRIGFVIDVVGYGSRSSPGQEAVQERLFRLVGRVLSDCGLGLADVDHEWSGDGVNLIFPSAIDPTTALPCLVTSVARRLAEDNRRYADRLRLRMAVGIGIVGPGPTGFAGPLILDINRLVDSAPLRAAIAQHDYTDVAVLLSDTLYSAVIRPGYSGLQAAELQVVDVAVKEFQRPAWLWISPSGRSTRLRTQVSP